MHTPPSLAQENEAKRETDIFFNGNRQTEFVIVLCQFPVGSFRLRTSTFHYTIYELHFSFQHVLGFSRSRRKFTDITVNATRTETNQSRIVTSYNNHNLGARRFLRLSTTAAICVPNFILSRENTQISLPSALSGCLKTIFKANRRFLCRGRTCFWWRTPISRSWPTDNVNRVTYRVWFVLYTYSKYSNIIHSVLLGVHWTYTTNVTSYVGIIAFHLQILI